MRGNKGFSFLEVLASMAIIGVLSYSFMTYRKNQIDAKVRDLSKLDYIKLTKNFLFLLSDDRSCTASLANYVSTIEPHPFAGSTRFNAGDIKGNESIPGVQVELHSSNFDGVRSSEMYKSGEQYGNLKIREVKLYLPDYTGLSLPLGYSSIQSEIYLSGQYKVSANQWRNFPALSKLVEINIHTNALGLSFILGCGEINKI